MSAMRAPTALLVVPALLLAACSGGTEGTPSTSSTTVAVTSPTILLGEWVRADLRPTGLLLGDSLTVAGDRFVVFEEIDGNQVVIWTSEDGRTWSSGDQSAFPPGNHVFRATGNQYGAVAIGWSGEPSWPPHPEFPPVFDRVWTSSDGLEWTAGQFQPVLPESTEYLRWYAEVTSALPHESGFLLVGQVRWYVDGEAIAGAMGLDGDVVAFPAVQDDGTCVLEGYSRGGDEVFSVPCIEYGIDPEADGLFLARPPVVVSGTPDGTWEVLETVGLEEVAVSGAGIGPDGVSLFTYPMFDVPRYWTSVDLSTWQMVEGIPGIEADGVYSMDAWRDGWVADLGYRDTEGGDLWWTRLGSSWQRTGVEGVHGPFAAGSFGLITVTSADESESSELWFTPDGVEIAVFEVAGLFGSDAVVDDLAVGNDSAVVVVSTFDESAEYPWVAEVWTGIPAGE